MGVHLHFSAFFGARAPVKSTSCLSSPDFVVILPCICVFWADVRLSFSKIWGVVSIYWLNVRVPILYDSTLILLYFCEQRLAGNHTKPINTPSQMYYIFGIEHYASCAVFLMYCVPVWMSTFILKWWPEAPQWHPVGTKTFYRCYQPKECFGCWHLDALFDRPAAAKCSPASPKWSLWAAVLGKMMPRSSKLNPAFTKDTYRCYQPKECFGWWHPHVLLPRPAASPTILKMGELVVSPGFYAFTLVFSCFRYKIIFSVSW